MKLYIVNLNFVDTISGTFSAQHCICLSTDKTLMEYLARKYKKRTNTVVFQHKFMSLKLMIGMIYRINLT